MPHAAKTEIAAHTQKTPCCHAEFMFGPVFNLLIMMMYSLLSGGLSASWPRASAWGNTAEPLTYSLTLYRAAMPSVFSYNPIWSTLVRVLPLRVGVMWGEAGGWREVSTGRGRLPSSVLQPT